MAQVRSVPQGRGKIVPYCNLPYGPRTQPLRGIYYSNGDDDDDCDGDDGGNGGNDDVDTYIHTYTHSYCTCTQTALFYIQIYRVAVDIAIIFEDTIQKVYMTETYK